MSKAQAEVDMDNFEGWHGTIEGYMVSLTIDTALLDVALILPEVKMSS